MWTRIRKPVISAFLVFYIYCTTVWLLAPSPAKNVFIHPIEGVFGFWGLWQAFDMFAPDPRSLNLHITANIEYSDGTSGEWTYPRMEQLGYLERMIKERYRKYGFDNLNADKNAVLWPDLTRWIARQVNTSQRHPVSIELERHWAYAPPPEEGLGKPALPHSNHYLFFKYQVKPEDLQ